MCFINFLTNNEVDKSYRVLTASKMSFHILSDAVQQKHCLSLLKSDICIIKATRVRHVVRDMFL